MKQSVTPLLLTAADTIGPTGTNPGAVAPTHELKPGWYTITWGAPCTFTFTFECSSGTIDFESQGSIELRLTNSLISCSVNCIVMKCADSKIRLIEDGVFETGGRSTIGPINANRNSPRAISTGISRRS